jgi:hypothetical protein
VSRRPALADALLAFLLAACGLAPVPSPAASQRPGSGGPGGTGPTIPDSPIVGVVTAVDSLGLNEVVSFTLRADDGRSWEFRVGTLENPTEFPPSHLSEHQATTVPVRVYFEFDGSELVAYRIEDAG